MAGQPRTAVAFVSILLILAAIKPLEVISRLVPPPGPNPGTNNAVHSMTLGNNNFAVVTSKKSPWKPVSPPTPTAGANSALVGASSRNG
nr:uncharacterized protein LOC109161179 [Ipomoea batatas]